MGPAPVVRRYTKLLIAEGGVATALATGASLILFLASRGRAAHRESERAQMPLERRRAVARRLEPRSERGVRRPRCGRVGKACQRLLRTMLACIVRLSSGLVRPAKPASPVPTDTVGPHKVPTACGQSGARPRGLPPPQRARLSSSPRCTARGSARSRCRCGATPRRHNPSVRVCACA